MAAKKTPTAPAATEEVAAEEVVAVDDQPTAAEEREAVLEAEEILADMPALRPAARYRMRHQNALRAIIYRHGSAINASTAAREKGEKISTEVTLSLVHITSDVDEFAESIALDRDAYVEWAEKNSKNSDVFMVLLNRLMGDLGE